MNDRPQTVAAVMLRAPKVLEPQVSVGHVAEFFADDHVHAALIADRGRLLTVLLRSDLLGQGSEVRAATLGSLAGRSVSPEVELESVRQQMITEGVRRLAVVDDEGHLVGLLCLKRSRTGFCTDEGVRARRAEREAGRVPTGPCGPDLA